MFGRLRSLLIDDFKYILLLLISLLVMGLAVGLITVVIEGKATAEQEKAYNHQQALQTMLARQALEDYFRTMMGDIDILASFNLTSFAQGEKDRSDIVASFLMDKAAHPEVLGYFYYSAKDAYFPAVTFIPPDANPVAMAVQGLAGSWTRSYWQDLGIYDKSSYGRVPPLLANSTRRWMGILRPVFIDKHFQGVLVEVVDLNPAILRYIEPMHSGKSGSAYLLDGIGNILYDRDLQIVGRTVFDGMHDGYANLQRVDQRMIIEDSGMDEYMFTLYRGGPVSRKLVAWDTLRVGGQKLIIALSAPTSEIDGNLDTLRLERNLLTGAIALFAAISIAIFFLMRQRLLQRQAGELQTQVSERTNQLHASQEALRASSETLQALFDYAPLAISLVDLDGRVLMWNPAAERLFGWQKGELLGCPLPFILPEFAAEHQRMTEQIMQGQNLMNFETILGRKDGTRVDITVSSAALHGHNGKIVARVSILEDITDRKRISAEAHMDEARLQSLVRISQQSSDSLASLLHMALDEAINLSGSRYGYLYRYDETLNEFSLHAFTQSVMDECEAANLSKQLKLDEVGLWGEAVRRRKPLVVNDYAAEHPQKHGLPMGHLPIRNLLSLPIYSDNRIVAVVGVANKPGSYTDLDVRELDLMMDSTWKIAERRLAEEKLRQNNARLAALDGIAQTLASIQFNMLETLQKVAEDTAEQFGDMCYLGLLAEDGCAITTQVIHIPQPEFQGRLYAMLRENPLDPALGFIGRAISSAQTLMVTEPTQAEIDACEQDMTAQFFTQFGLRSALFAPLVTQGHVIGILVLGRTADGRPAHTPEDQAYVQELANRVALAVTNARLYQDNHRQLEHLQALYSIETAITSSLDLNSTLNMIVNQLTGQLKADAADILLFNRHTQRLEFVAGAGFHGSAAFSSLRVGEGPAGRAARQNRMIYLPALNEPLPRGGTGGSGGTDDLNRVPDYIANEGFTTYFGLPLEARGQLKGVLEVFHRTTFAPNREWLDTLQTLAGQAAIAVDHAALFADLERSNFDLTLAYDETIEGWSRALDLRDKETEGHSLRVKDMTERLARALGVRDVDLIHVRRGAWLHDIGKMGVPDRILHKPGALDDDEWEIMRRHPMMALEMLYPIQYLRPALDIPVSHHERWDGKGYPRGLAGEKIPLAARIFAVVDVYDALTSDRPYRKAWTSEQALQHIREQAGKHFDPRVVDVFLKMKNS